MTDRNTTDRIFMPGSNWLFYKIYCGAKTADELLANEIYDILSLFYSRNYILDWFFVRYRDPEPHIRLRFYFQSTITLGDAIIIIENCFRRKLLDGFIHKICIETYTREMERYGREKIVFVEQLFNNDSQMILNLLRLYSIRQEEKLRWLVALSSADALLHDFGLSISRRKDLLFKMSRDFGVEFNKDREMYERISQKFRQNRIEMDDMISTVKRKESYPEIHKNIDYRSKQNEKPIAGLLRTDHDEKNNEMLVSDLLHMMMNRFFRSRQRLHEMVLYDLLFRYYKSIIRRMS